jgi:hypothetical protein
VRRTRKPSLRHTMTSWSLMSTLPGMSDAAQVTVPSDARSDVPQCNHCCCCHNPQASAEGTRFWGNHGLLCKLLTHLIPLCRLRGRRDESEEISETSVVRAIMELSNQQHLGSCDIKKDACLKSGEHPRSEGGAARTSTFKIEKSKKSPALRTPPTRGQSPPCPRLKPGKRMAAQSAQDASLARALQRQLDSVSAMKRHRPYQALSRFRLCEHPPTGPGDQKTK